MMSKVLKINSKFGEVKVVFDGFLSIGQGNDLIALLEEEFIELVKLILENIKNEQRLENLF